MKKICICTTVSITMKTFVVETAKYLHENCGYDNQFVFFVKKDAPGEACRKLADVFYKVANLPAIQDVIANKANVSPKSAANPKLNPSPNPISKEPLSLINPMPAKAINPARNAFGCGRLRSTIQLRKGTSAT